MHKSSNHNTDSRVACSYNSVSSLNTPLSPTEVIPILYTTPGASDCTVSGLRLFDMSWTTEFPRRTRMSYVEDPTGGHVSTRKVVPTCVKMMSVGAVGAVERNRKVFKKVGKVWKAKAINWV